MVGTGRPACPNGGTVAFDPCHGNGVQTFCTSSCESNSCPCGFTCAKQGGGRSISRQRARLRITDAAAGDDGGWTACTAPGGYRICGAQDTPCAANAQDPMCDCRRAFQFPHPPNDVDICAGGDIADADYWLPPYFCPDGFLVVATPASTYNEPDGSLWAGGFNAYVHIEIAQLYARNGWAAAARYADFSHFTGDPLPTPSSCPQVNGIQLCGGPCGDSCPAGTHCTGRSPGHPYSVCIPEPSSTECGAGANGAYFARGDDGWGCFAFQVPAQDQGIIPSAAYCTPISWCRAAAANLPGGGQCDDRPIPHDCFQ
jgi:hypothetical protein